MTSLCLLSLLLLVYIQTASAHYYGGCIGSNIKTQIGPYCTDDNIYVYVNTNHGSLDQSWFRAANQARVDVKLGAATVYNKRPAVNNVMTTTSNLINVEVCSGPTASPSNTICQVNSDKPNHCSARGSYWYRFGPITQQSAANAFTADVYGFGDQGIHRNLAQIVASFPYTTVLCINTYPALVFFYFSSFIFCVYSGTLLH